MMRLAAACTMAAALAVLAAPAARAQLTVTEILYNPASSDDAAWEYIELYNCSAVDSVALGGWVLDDDDGNPLTSSNVLAGTVAPLGTVVLFNVDANTLTAVRDAWGAAARFVGVRDWPSLANDGDRFGLWDGFLSYNSRHWANARIDITYHDWGDWPADDGVASVHLVDLAADCRIGANWALSRVGDSQGAYRSNPAGSGGDTNVGSPGSVVPEPATAALVALGAAAARLARRRRGGGGR